MQTGTVEFYDGKKGIGSIRPENGGEIVRVHVSALDRAGLGSLVIGQKLHYWLEKDDFGRETAAKLQLI